MSGLTEQQRERLREYSRDDAAFAALQHLVDEVTRQAIAPFERITQLGLRLNKTTSIQDVLDALTELALENDADYTSLFYIDTDENGVPDSLFVVAQAGELTKGVTKRARFKINAENPLTREWMENPDQAVFIEDVATDPHLVSFVREQYLNSGILASVAIPFQKDGDWIGLANFHWGEARQFSEAEHLMYSHLPLLVSPVVESHRVREQLNASPNVQQEQSGNSLRLLAADLSKRTRVLDDMLAAIPYHYIMIARDGSILYVNPTTLNAMRAREEDVIGKLWDAFNQLSEESKARVQAALDETLATGKLGHFDHIVSTVDGQRYLEVYVAPIHDEAGDVVAAVFSGQDITDRQAAETAAREAAVERARKALLTQLLRGAGHAFRNPLAVIGTKLYLIERAPDEDRRHQHLAALSEQTDIILGLVKALHTLARLEDRDYYSFADIRISSMLERVHRQQEPAITGKGHTLIVEAEDESLMISGNEPILSEGLDQVIKNAIQYTPSGSEIRVRAEHRDDQVCILVSDNGPGIPPERHDEIFEYFAWFDVPDAPRGHGLGLSLAKKIVELHGGKISVESAPGEGSTFVIYLPILTTSD